ncbi:hypothetical protein HK099_001920 [Clydaea vesicula]|uniref:Uncharacterized protein n=1 Tax=Clydaea vesicula TaxID=447962 RepID=A0AAD5UBH9_9FUNG|nr:hypothetical protein HK099_001920 [Clydaea vesicula]
MNVLLLFTSMAGISLYMPFCWLIGDIFSITGAVLNLSIFTVILQSVLFFLLDGLFLSQHFYYGRKNKRVESAGDIESIIHLHNNDSKSAKSVDSPKKVNENPLETSFHGSYLFYQGPQFHESVYGSFKSLRSNSKVSRNSSLSIRSIETVDITLPSPSMQSVPSMCEHRPSMYGSPLFSPPLSPELHYMSRRLNLSFNSAQNNKLNPKPSFKTTRSLYIIGIMVFFSTSLTNFWHQNLLSESNQSRIFSRGSNLMESSDVNTESGFKDRQLLAEIFGYISMILYSFGGRIPQIYLNFRRKSVNGLNFKMFFFSLIANFLSIMSILFYSVQFYYLFHNLPWILMSSFAIIFDAFIVFQFYLYRNDKKLSKIKVLPYHETTIETEERNINLEIITQNEQYEIVSERTEILSTVKYKEKENNNHTTHSSTGQDEIEKQINENKFQNCIDSYLGRQCSDISEASKETNLEKEI